jgi:hypothetical protein
MRTPIAIASLALALSAVATLHCGESLSSIPPPDADGGGAEGSPPGQPPDAPLVPASKVDLLFAVDNSATMADKQALLATSVNRILRQLIEPTSGHAPIKDVHLGVVSSSLGTPSGDVCDPTNPRNNDRAHLLNQAKGGAVVTGAEKGFLTFGPGGLTDVAALENAAAQIILGVDQKGCGFESQLESMYRFLVQPDPPEAIAVENGKAVYKGVDATLLAQRKDFLRPDSAVAVVMITDEDDSNVDPMSVGGQGWVFASKNFPGSKVIRGTAAQGTTAARATAICESDPAAGACRSCTAGCGGVCPDLKDDANCKISGQAGMAGDGYDGFWDAKGDPLNVRFYRMKQRFGVDPQYPVDRYVQGLTQRLVPNRDTEHPSGGPYVHSPTCTSPLFAAALPASATEELCKLPDGSRSRELVFFALIGGVPNQLLTPAPDWTKILGANPAAYDLTGIDPHMIPSVKPRAGLPPPAPRGDNGPDPIHGREWDTQDEDLQFACTFPLSPPVTCTVNDLTCLCTPPDPRSPPVCTGNQQVRGRAFPTVRELRVAKGLGDRAIVASICAADPAAGYAPLLDALAGRMARSLAQ